MINAYNTFGRPIDGVGAAYWRIRVRDKNFDFVGEVDQFVSLSIELKHNDEDKWEMELDWNSLGAELFRQIASDPENGGKGGVYIERNGHFILSGPLTQIRRQVSPDGKRLFVYGASDLHWLRKHLALPHPKRMSSPHMTAMLYDDPDLQNNGHTDYYPNVQSSPNQDERLASSHVHVFVRDNIGEDQEYEGRRLPFLETVNNYVGLDMVDSEGGVIRTSSAGENLLELCKTIVEYSEYHGSPITMVAKQVGNKVRFECVEGQSKPNAVFSPELGSIVEYTVDRIEPKANQILMGGSGEGSARYFAYAGDEPSKALYGRIEAMGEFRGAPNSASDSNNWSVEKPMLIKEVYAALNENAEQTIFDFKFQETPGLQYGRDFVVGDEVTVRVENEQTTDLVRSVSFGVSGDTEDINMVVGSQNAVSKGFRLFDDIRDMEHRYNGLTRRTLGE